MKGGGIAIEHARYNLWQSDRLGIAEQRLEPVRWLAKQAHQRLKSAPVASGTEHMDPPEEEIRLRFCQSLALSRLPQHAQHRIGDLFGCLYRPGDRRHRQRLSRPEFVDQLLVQHELPPLDRPGFVSRRSRHN